MNIQTFLKRLRVELKDMPEEEKTQLVEEISFHINKGLSDPAMGKTEQERLERVSDELGNPEDLGRRLKNIHHPKHWLDYILVVIPRILIIPIINWIILLLLFKANNGPAAANVAVYWLSRASIVLQFGLVLLGVRFYKRQGLPTGLAYWLSSLWLMVFSLCFREKRWLFLVEHNQGIAFESILWNIALLGTLIWLVNTLIKNRDNLLLTMALIPSLMTIGNIATMQMVSSGAFPGGYSLFNWNILGDFGVYEIAHIIWPVLFLFPGQRFFKWLGLLIYAASVTVLNLIASSTQVDLLILWVLPSLLVLINCMIEIINKNRSQIA